MKFDPEKHHRRSIRLKGYRYSQCGTYFITICAQNRKCLFGKIENAKTHLNDAGKMLQKYWLFLKNKFPNISLDEYVVMPNHFHGIIIVGASLVGAPNETIPDAPNETIPDAPNETISYSNDIVGASLVGAPNETVPDAPNETISYSNRTGSNRAGTRPAPTIGDMVGAFKSLTTNEYISGVKSGKYPPFEKSIWQRNYWEHIIRNELELQKIREYIQNNPIRWELDSLFIDSGGYI